MDSTPCESPLQSGTKSYDIFPHLNSRLRLAIHAVDRPPCSRSQSLLRNSSVQYDLGCDTEFSTGRYYSFRRTGQCFQQRGAAYFSRTFFARHADPWNLLWNAIDCPSFWRKSGGHRNARIWKHRNYIFIPSSF